jgi:hypothetical protein
VPEYGEGFSLAVKGRIYIIENKRLNQKKYFSDFQPAKFFVYIHIENQQIYMLLYQYHRFHLVPEDWKYGQEYPMYD